MKVNTRTQDELTVIEVSGDIDSRSAPTLQNVLLPLVTPDCKLILELSKVEFMTSAGLRVLLSLRRQLPQSGQLILVGLNDQIRDTMTTTGFLELFIIQPTLPAGLAALI